MATLTKGHIDSKSHLVSWTAILSGETGDAVEFAFAADRSIQVTGAFSAATLVLEGSNNGSNWVTLNDPFGNALSFTSAGLKAVLELTRYVRARVSGGDGSTNLNAYLVTKA